MKQQLQEIARSCLNGAETGSMTFPQIVQTLTAAGFDGYQVDFRRGNITYYLPDGALVQLSTARGGYPVAEQFQVDVIQQAIRDAQKQVAGYTYGGFCKAVTGAGCAGYLVSFLGKRVLYFGRTAEAHTEYFPGSN